MPEKFANVLVTQVYLLSGGITRSLRQSHPAQQVGVTRVGVQAVEPGIVPKIQNTVIPLAS